jgi:hypothetical protein
MKKEIKYFLSRIDFMEMLASSRPPIAAILPAAFTICTKIGIIIRLIGREPTLKLNYKI